MSAATGDTRQTIKKQLNPNKHFCSRQKIDTPPPHTNRPAGLYVIRHTAEPTHTHTSPEMSAAASISSDLLASKKAAVAEAKEAARAARQAAKEAEAAAKEERKAARAAKAAAKAALPKRPRGRPRKNPLPAAASETEMDNMSAASSTHFDADSDSEIAVLRAELSSLKARHAALEIAYHKASHTLDAIRGALSVATL